MHACEGRSGTDGGRWAVVWGGVAARESARGSPRTGMGSADGGGPPRTPAVAMTPRATLTRKAGESSRPMLLWQRTMTERGTEPVGVRAQRGQGQGEAR